MAKKNKCGTTSEETPVCKFYKNLTKLQKLEENKRAISSIKKKSLEIERSYAACSLEKSETTFSYYRDLNNAELSDMKSSSEIIKANIDKHAMMDTVDLGKEINDTSKLLNELKNKLHEANNAACSMRNCLQSLLGFKDDCVPKQLECVTALAKTLSKDGRNVADAMVSVAGIHTFSNIETLQPFADRLTTKLSSLKGEVDSLAVKARGNEEDAQSELSEVLERLNIEEFECFNTSANINAYDSTRNFICKGECRSIECVNEICKKLGKKETDTDKPQQNPCNGDED